MNHSTNCKHRPIYEIESKLDPHCDDGLYQKMYIERGLIICSFEDNNSNIDNPFSLCYIFPSLW